MPRRLSKSNPKKSSNWANRQNRDQFVRQARSMGFRARSVFKLEQIDQKYKLIKPNLNIVDLGSTPGSWCQYAVTRIAGKGQVVGVDLLPMKEIANVKFIHGDFTTLDTHRLIADCFKGSKIDLVLSDMAPNITGIRITDQANAENLQDAILAFCRGALNPGGNVLTKLFEGETVSVVRKRFNQHFDQVQMVKPEASRSESKEIYLLARGFIQLDTNSAVPES